MYVHTWWCTRLIIGVPYLFKNASKYFYYSFSFDAFLFCACVEEASCGGDLCSYFWSDLDVIPEVFADGSGMERLLTSVRRQTDVYLPGANRAGLRE